MLYPLKMCPVNQYKCVIITVIILREILMDFIFNHLKNNHQYLIICPKDIKKVY